MYLYIDIDIDMYKYIYIHICVCTSTLLDYRACPKGSSLSCQPATHRSFAQREATQMGASA